MSLSVALDRVDPSLAVKTKTIFTASCLQYSTAMLYLDTSMYPDQRSHTLAFQHTDIARHSKQILALASEMMEGGNTGYHITMPILLAGLVSRDSKDRETCRAYLHAMKRAGPDLNVTRTEKLLEEMFAEQPKTCQSGTEPRDVSLVEPESLAD